MKKEVFKTAEGVKISFTGLVEKKNIIQMVENCNTGQCDCMADETKEKIINMTISGEDGNVDLDLSGSLTKTEIEDALKKSSVINNT